MTAIADTAPGPIVRWHYLGYSALALAVMTADEKAALVHRVSGGAYVGRVAANARLGIPELHLEDGPAGTRWKRA